jgi:hypothetical protein
MNYGSAYWGMIADKLRARGWSVGWMKYLGPDGVELWQADAKRGEGEARGIHICRAEVLAAAFLELEEMTSAPKG